MKDEFEKILIEALYDKCSSCKGFTVVQEDGMPFDKKPFFGISFMHRVCSSCAGTGKEPSLFGEEVIKLIKSSS